MGISRHQYTDEFKREALELLTSSGRPLVRLPVSWGFPLHGCGLGATATAGAPRRSRLAARIWPRRMLACGARMSACGWSGRY